MGQMNFYIFATDLEAQKELFIESKAFSAEQKISIILLWHT
jgi:hypothetical protein